MNRAIILAAGKGTRLVKGFDFPKPLKRVGGVPLIVRVLRSLDRAGVDEVAIVVGYLGDELQRGLERYNFRLSLHFIENDEYDKPNGTSLLKAREFVTGPTYLMMSDHLWSDELFSRVASYPLAEDETVLGVDRAIDRCFDLEDATKVRIEGDRVVEIGKELTRYDVIDTGVFRITPALIEALDRADGPEGVSLSQGVGALAAAGKMRVADVGDATWIDVDTPRAHQIAEQLIRRFGDRLRAPGHLPATLMAAGA